MFSKVEVDSSIVNINIVTVQNLILIFLCGQNIPSFHFTLQVLGHNLLKFIIESNYEGIPLLNVKIIIKQVQNSYNFLQK